MARGGSDSPALGKELARIHATGFDQPDLYAKHVLVKEARPGRSFAFSTGNGRGGGAW